MRQSAFIDDTIDFISCIDLRSLRIMHDGLVIETICQEDLRLSIMLVSGFLILSYVLFTSGQLLRQH
jgi:hypothetical protein